MSLKSRIDRISKRIEAVRNRISKIFGVLRYSEYDNLVLRGRESEIQGVLLVPDPMTAEKWESKAIRQQKKAMKTDFETNNL